MNRHSLAVAAARHWDRLRPPPPGVTVLIYHRVGGGSASPVDLDVREFAAQLEYLAAHHRVITLDEALDALARGQAEHAVILTFDDGTADLIEHALPLLVHHRLPATLYAATSFIDAGTPFPWDAPPVSWAGLREAVSTGFLRVESHSHTHPHFSGLDGAAARDEVQRASDLIAEHLDRIPSHFAYPRAVPPSPAAEIVVRSMHRSAALAGNGANTVEGFDAHRLRRTPVRRRESMEVFAARAEGGLRLEGALRAVRARAW